MSAAGYRGHFYFLKAGRMASPTVQNRFIHERHQNTFVKFNARIFVGAFFERPPKTTGKPLRYCAQGEPISLRFAKYKSPPYKGRWIAELFGGAVDINSPSHKFYARGCKDHNPFGQWRVILSF